MRKEADHLLRDFFGEGKTPSAAPRRSCLDRMKELDASLDFDSIGRPTQRDIEGFAAQKTETSATPQPQKESEGEIFRALYTDLCGHIIGQESFLLSLCTALRRPFVTGDRGGTILVRGDECSGRHTALKRAAAFLRERRLLSCGEVHTVDLSLYPDQEQEKLFVHDMYSALSGDAGLIVFDNYERCHPAFLGRLSELVCTGKMNLSSRYVLQKGRLVNVGTALTGDGISALDKKDKYLIFVSAKDENTMAALMGAKTVNALSAVCATQPFTPEAAAKIAARQGAALTDRCRTKLGITLDVPPQALADWLAGGFSPRDRLQGILDRADRLWRGLAEYKLRTDCTGNVKLHLDGARPGAGEERTDLSALLPTEYRGEKDAVKAELDGIVGLSGVKEYILSLERHCEVLARRRAMGLSAAGVNMHMIFMGNPGTGKTTVARITAKYLKAIGVLSGGQLVEVSRADLVGKYVGHTAPLTRQVIKSALGGVLFIDEAYSLCRGENDTFGLEAIDTLVKGMEDNRDDLVVILAGYTREMEDFLMSNSGLASRFPNKIEFPDYTAAEMVSIACSVAKGKGYFIADDAKAKLLGYFERVQSAKDSRSGNGRLARNVVEKALLNQSARVIKDPNAPLDRLCGEDFETGE